MQSVVMDLLPCMTVYGYMIIHRTSQVQINPFTMSVPHMRHPEEKKLTGQCEAVSGLTLQLSSGPRAESGPAPRPDFLAARKFLFSTSKHTGGNGLNIIRKSNKYH